MPPIARRAGKLGATQSRGIAVNAHGFPALPNELYLEILSHLPKADDVWLGERRDPYRQLALYHLSQMCRSLRKFFLRYAWERIEVFEGMWTPTGKLSGNELAQEMLRQLETVVAGNPDLRKYVNAVDLILDDATDVPVLAQSLSLLPHLHTIQFTFRFGGSYVNTRDFSRFRYPTVHTLSISGRSSRRNIIIACPNIRNLSCNGGTHTDWFLMENVGSIERLAGVWRLEYTLPVLVEKFPRLSDISLDCEILRKNPNHRNSLLSLPLHTIRLRLDDFPRGSPFIAYVPATPNERRSWIDLAMGILAKCSNKTKKRVIVVNLDKTVEVYHVSAHPYTTAQ